MIRSEENKLVSLARKGDKAAFEKLVFMHKDRLFLSARCGFQISAGGH